MDLQNAVWTAFIWLRIGASGGLLHNKPSGFIKGWEIDYLSDC